MAKREATLWHTLFPSPLRTPADRVGSAPVTDWSSLDVTMVGGRTGPLAAEPRVVTEGVDDGMLFALLETLTTASTPRLPTPGVPAIVPDLPTAPETAIPLAVPVSSKPEDDTPPQLQRAGADAELEEGTPAADTPSTRPTLHIVSLSSRGFPSLLPCLMSLLSPASVVGWLLGCTGCVR